MKVLESARLNLRHVELRDAGLFVELLNDPAFIRYVADRGVRTSEDAIGYIQEKVLPSYEKFGFGSYVVELKETGEVIGICGLIKRETLDDVDVGFSILRRFWGQGYATEAAAAVMEYGRTEFNLPRVVAIASADNANSINVLKKLGLRLEKTIRLPGYEVDGQLYV
ncbi:MAG: GNAT family N-acetyltransferase [Chthoniobacterales bacterium]